MEFSNEIAKVKELIDRSKEILLVTHDHPTFDSIGSTLALYLGLCSLNKKITVVCPDPMTVTLSNFVGVDKVTTNLGRKNFIISLDYIDGSIEKVSYNIAGDKFNLVIEPQPGFEPFSAEKVHYSYTNSQVDLIVAVDTIGLGGFKDLYEAEKELYADKTLVNIDHHPNNNHFGTVNLIDPLAASTAELVGALLAGLGIRLNADIATNLLNAVYGATDSFQNPNISARAFELAANCIRAGGRKFLPPKTTEELPKVETIVPDKPQIKPTQVQSRIAPSDWLKPKIFKSSNLS